MLKKSKTVSFQSPIVQDNETSDRIPVIENLNLRPFYFMKIQLLFSETNPCLFTPGYWPLSGAMCVWPVTTWVTTLAIWWTS